MEGRSLSEQVYGLLEVDKKGGRLRDSKWSFRPRPTDPLVPRQLIQKLNLVQGAHIVGLADGGKQSNLILKRVDTCCGMPLAEFNQRRRFNDLVSIDPYERFHLACLDEMTMRVVDIIAPIGKGTRSLIVSPPKAGKTTLLEHIAKAIRISDPDVRVIVLLINERPEEETTFRRSVDAEVLATRIESPAEDSVRLTKLVLDHVRCELECGRDVVVLIDSLTRLARAFNLAGGGGGHSRGRTMSGGVDAGALEIPRRFFGLARNVEGGGSVTIVATALVDTGSRMDDLIFEEFKGTGNSEIVLDRKLAEARIFPAIDINRSGTRKEEKLLTREEAASITMVRRTLADRPSQRAMEQMLTGLAKFPNNDAFLASIQARR